MAISLRLRPSEAKQTKIGGLGTKMSKPGLYREASHSGSWYSASGNCQYSSVGVSMLHASCVIFVCFYLVCLLPLCYIGVLRHLTLGSFRILKQYPIKTITCCKKLDRHHQSFNVDSNRFEKSAIVFLHLSTAYSLSYSAEDEIKLTRQFLFIPSM